MSTSYSVFFFIRFQRVDAKFARKRRKPAKSAESTTNTDHHASCMTEDDSHLARFAGLALANWSRREELSEREEIVMRQQRERERLVKAVI